MHGVSAFDEIDSKEKSVQNSTSSIVESVVDKEDLKVVDAFGSETKLGQTEMSSEIPQENQGEETEEEKQEEETEEEKQEETEEEKQEIIAAALMPLNTDLDDEDEDEIEEDSGDVNFTLKGKLGKQEVVPIVGVHDYSNMKNGPDVDVDELGEKLKNVADAETPNYTPERFRTDNAIDVEFREVTDADFEDTEDLTKVEQNAAVEAEKSLMDKAIEYYNYMDEHPIESLKKGLSVAGDLFGSIMRRHTFNKMKRAKRIFRQGDFDYTLRKDGSLILLKYRGNSGKVIIPSRVGNKPVLYIHPDFLFSQTNPLDNYYTRGVVGKIVGKDDGALEGSSTINEVVLPESLLAISDKTFTGCATIKHLVIPSSVRSISNNAFYGSSIKKLFFNGQIPDNFEVDKFAGNVYARVDEFEYEAGGEQDE